MYRIQRLGRLNEARAKLHRNYSSALTCHDTRGAWVGDYDRGMRRYSLNGPRLPDVHGVRRCLAGRSVVLDDRVVVYQSQQPSSIE